MKAISLSALIAAALTSALPLATSAQPKTCPPGLAKKSPACVPPGQAKKRVTRTDETSRDVTAVHREEEEDDDPRYVTSDYIRLEDPTHYDLDPDRTYYRLDDDIYQVDGDTGEILNFVASLATLVD